MVTNAVSDQKLHLLSLPLEIRLHIYGLLFRTSPIYCSKFEPGIKTPYVFEHRGRQHRCFLRTRYGSLFMICKQIKVEAQSVFQNESPLDIYNWPMYTSELPELMSKFKHIICSVKRIEACFGSEASNVKFDCLQTVTIVDDSHFFHDLTDGRCCWPISSNRAYRRKKYGLDDAVAVLRKRGIKNIVIRSGRILYEKREITLKFNNFGVKIIIRGINVCWSWSERVKDHIMYALSLEPLQTKFDFHSEWEWYSPGPYEVRVDYTTNLLERQASPVNEMLAKLDSPARVLVRDGQFTLLGRSFDGRILAKLTRMVHEKLHRYQSVISYRCNYTSYTFEAAFLKTASIEKVIDVLSKRFSWVTLGGESWLLELSLEFKKENNLQNLKTTLREGIISERYLKTVLYEWMGERKALDEMVEICECLAVASKTEQISS